MVEKNCQKPEKAAALDEVTYDLPEIVVAPNSSSHVVSRRLGPGCYFRPTGFRIPDDTADDLLITDIKVGKNSQLNCAGAVPASLFAESVPEAQVRMDYLEPGMLLTLSIHNVSNRAVTFRGQVRGAVDPVAEDLPDCNKIPVVVGLGCTILKPGIDMATIHVEAQVDLTPRRLYVPRLVLDEYDVESFACEMYLNTTSPSQVPASLLHRTNLAGEGLIKLEPTKVIPAQTFFSVGIVRRAVDPGSPIRSFSGAVLAIAGW